MNNWENGDKNKICLNQLALGAAILVTVYSFIKTEYLVSFLSLGAVFLNYYVAKYKSPK